MAKRKTFDVTVDGKWLVVKYAFNTARREIPKIIENIAEVGEVWEMIEENQTFDEFNLNRIGTHMIWVERGSGRQIIAEVTLR